MALGVPICSHRTAAGISGLSANNTVQPAPELTRQRQERVWASTKVIPKIREVGGRSYSRLPVRYSHLGGGTRPLRKPAVESTWLQPVAPQGAFLILTLLTFLQHRRISKSTHRACDEFNQEAAMDVLKILVYISLALYMLGWGSLIIKRVAACGCFWSLSLLTVAVMFV